MHVKIRTGKIDMATKKEDSTSGGRRILCDDKDINCSGESGLVSVITVVRDGEINIKRCIDSVLNQSYRNFEHIIIDGASSDKTIAIVDEYGDKIELWISEPDSGIYNALNKGISLAKGEFYVPLGCDDILLPTGIENMMLYAKDYLVTYGNVQIRNEAGVARNISRNHSAGVLISKKAHSIYGLYDESYRIAADTKFLEMVEQDQRALRINDVVGEFFLGGASSNYGKAILEHVRAKRETGSWGRVESFLWLAPRIAWNRVRFIFK